MKFRFMLTEYQWNTLALTPLWIFPTVALADGKLDEYEKNALYTISKNAEKFENSLLKEIVEYYNEDFDGVLKKFYDDNRKIKSALKDVAEILEKEIPNDIATDFKKIMIAIGYFIANASGDEFAGKISPRERKTLLALAKSLKLNIETFNEKPTLNDILDVLE